MADMESKVSALELAQDAAKQADGVYGLALELQTLLEAVGDANDPPKWAYPLCCMVTRITSAADHAHTATVRVRMDLESPVGAHS